MNPVYSLAGDPYYSARLLRTADGQQINKVIIETSYPLLLTQGDMRKLPAAPPGTVRKDWWVLRNCDLEVYGEEVTIYGPISVPGRTVSIVARVIHTLPSENGLPGISVDGWAGQPAPEAALKGVPANGDPTNTKRKKAHGNNGEPGKGGKVGMTGPAVQAVPGGDGEGRLNRNHNCTWGGTWTYDPVMDGECGNPGDAGKPAGNIILHAWRLDLWFPESIVKGEQQTVEFPTPFTLSARGGAGGKGQDGQPGADGGDAGWGANFVEGFTTITPSQNGKAGDGGNGGFGGRGGPGGTGGIIDIRIVEPHPAFAPNSPGRPYMYISPQPFNPPLPRFSRVVLDAQGGPGGEGGEAGMPGKGGDGGKGGKGSGKSYPLIPEPFRRIVREGYPETRKGNDGYYGDTVSKVVAAKPEPVRGAEGAAGTITVLNPAFSGQACVLARTSQLQMVLESVRAHYLAAGCEPDDSIKHDLEYVAQALMAVRSSSKDGQREIAAQLLNQVALLMKNAATGCDIFGRARNFVPVLSVATHEKALKDSLAVLKENAAIYDAYRNALQNATESAEKFEAAAGQLGALTAYLIGMLAELNGERRKTQGEIDAFEEKLNKAKGKLRDELLKLEAKIHEDFGLSVPTLLNCLTQVAFLGVPLEKTLLQPTAPGGAPTPRLGFSGLHAMNSALLSAVQVSAALNEGLTSVLSDAGEPVKKEHVLDRLEAIEPGKLDDHLRARENGTYVVEDGRKLSIMREDLERLCRQFRERLKTKPLVEAMNDYVDVIDQRGRYLLRYNSLVAGQVELVSQIRAAKAREEQAQSLRAEAALHALPEMTAMVSDLYDQVRLHCLNELSMASRALAFWKAEPYGNVAELIPGKPKVVNYQTLNNAWLRVQTDIIDHLEKAFSTPQRFPAVKDAVALPLGRSPFGVWIVLTREQYPDEFADLQDGLAATFTFEPKSSVKNADPAKPPVFPFHGKADVRVTQVRVFLPGLACANPPLTVKVMHGGHEYVQNPYGKVVEFRHEPRGFTFAYTPPKGRALLSEEDGWVTAEALIAGGSEDGSLGLAVEKTALRDCSYTPLGPFTDWTIEIPAEDNPGLDRSKIERIVLDFHGYHHEFAHRAHA